MKQAVEPSDLGPPTVQPTTRLYWQDDHCFETTARIVGLSEQAVALDQTCFYSGGGGQPADEGWLWLPQGEMLAVPTVTAADGVIWHALSAPVAAECLGQSVTVRVNVARRLALMRHHTALHVLNTIVYRDYAGWITGVQIGVEYSRIDFTLAGFSPALCDELTTKVNGVLAANHTVKADWLAEAEFHQRGDLRRTLEAKPPMIDGQVRVVEIVGFDVQACGGTHVYTTGEVGTFSIFRTENKGKQNKRFYVRLDLPTPHLSPSA